MNKSTFPSVPRIESLHHRLKSAKGPDGEALGLVDELMVFLEDPPPDVRDRWQAGAELCATHGITTSRVAVWTFYRTYVLQWRHKAVPVLAEDGGAVTEESTAQLLEQARHLVALRAVESLQQPELPARVLVGLVQNENRRQELLLAREKFEDQLDTKVRRLRQQQIERMEKEALAKVGAERSREFLERFIAQSTKKETRDIPPTSSTPIQAHSGS